jgi:hypothetical protein
MNESQKKAIKSLENAFKKCKDAKLVFLVECEELHAIDRKTLNEGEKRVDDENGTFGVGIVNNIETHNVETYNTILDSGAA